MDCRPHGGYPVPWPPLKWPGVIISTWEPILAVVAATKRRAPKPLPCPLVRRLLKGACGAERGKEVIWHRYWSHADEVDSCHAKVGTRNCGCRRAFRSSAYRDLPRPLCRLPRTHGGGQSRTAPQSFSTTASQRCRFADGPAPPWYSRNGNGSYTLASGAG